MSVLSIPEDVAVELIRQTGGLLVVVTPAVAGFLGWIVRAWWTRGEAQAVAAKADERVKAARADLDAERTRLIDDYRDMLAASRQTIDDLRSELSSVTVKIQHLETQLTELSGEVRTLTGHIASLEEILRRHELPVPARPAKVRTRP